MDVGKLAIFLDTVAMGSMKKAAEKYNYTQGGMLYLVNSVEQELGLPVIRRDHRGISWNPAGRELEPYLRQLVETERELAEKTALLQQRKGRSLTVGAYPSVASLILPQVMLASWPRAGKPASPCAWAVRSCLTGWRAARSTWP